MKIEVAYAEAENTIVKTLDMPLNATVQEALDASGIINELPKAVREKLSLGIFGKKIKDKQQALRPGDRLEIYRPLIISPMEARRLRAKKKTD